MSYCSLAHKCSSSGANGQKTKHKNGLHFTATCDKKLVETIKQARKVQKKVMISDCYKQKRLTVRIVVFFAARALMLVMFNRASICTISPGLATILLSFEILTLYKPSLFSHKYSFLYRMKSQINQNRYICETGRGKNENSKCRKTYK